MFSQQEFPVIDVVAASVAIFEKNGYVKKSHLAGAKNNDANVSLLRKHFYGAPECRVQVTEKHIALAKEMISYLQLLTVKSIERPLSDYEKAVLKFVTSDTTNHSTMNIAASIPSTYATKQDRDKWEERERTLSRNSQFVGSLNKTQNFWNLKVENTVDLKNDTESRLYCCSDQDGNIIKFFTIRPSIIKFFAKGDSISVRGHVKDHTISKFHNGKETLLNRVQVITLPDENVV